MNLVLATLLFLHTQTPEEVFNRIEDAVEKAATVRTTFRFELVMKGVEGKLEGTMAVLLKEGNKASIVESHRRPKETGEFSLTSDGSRMKFFKPAEEATPTDLKSGLSSLIVRVGLVKPLLLVGHYDDPADPWNQATQPGPFESRKWYKVFDVQAGEDQGAGTLTYKIKGRYETLKIDAKVWYDPKTFVLRKRVFQLQQRGNPDSTLTEIYDEFVLNADIPDEKFKLPEKK